MASLRNIEHRGSLPCRNPLARIGLWTKPIAGGTRINAPASGRILFIECLTDFIVEQQFALMLSRLIERTALMSR